LPVVVDIENGIRITLLDGRVFEVVASGSDEYGDPVILIGAMNWVPAIGEGLPDEISQIAHEWKGTDRAHELGRHAERKSWR
jgi:dihydrodipicolinate synthase/N-acetylneuraminate lyase